MGIGELGLDPHEMFCLSWVEWEYKIENYRINEARKWEIMREHYRLVYSALGGKAMTAAELIPLYTDADTTVSKSGEKEESNSELWARLVGSSN